ncbi:MAG: HEAT repeat domain-containing protein [Planctomycetes bacterium]|nr:HEAT repeat domain-containing protein [Planctomycetota bacterium]
MGRARIVLAGLVAVILVAPMATVGGVRTWTDVTGNFTVEAELHKVEADRVHLKRATDGKVVVVPLDRLSHGDRRYLAVRPDAQRQGPPAADGHGNLSPNSGEDEIDRLPKSVEDLLHDLRTRGITVKGHRRDEPNETYAALVAMGRPIVPRLCEVLRDRNGYRLYGRSTIVKVLGEIGDPRAASALIEVVADPESPYVGPALKEVGCENIEPLIEQLETCDPQFRWKVKSAISSLNHPRTFELFSEMYRKARNPHDRADAAIRMAMTGDARAVEPLIETIEAIETIEDNHTRNDISSMARALGKFGDPRAVEPLLAIMKRDPVKLGPLVDQTLGDLKDERAVEPLLEMVDKLRYDRARDAIKALAKIGGEKAAIGLLQRRKAFCGLSEAELREAGLVAVQVYRRGRALEKALAAMGPSAAGPLLAEFQDAQSPIRIEVLRLLGETGDPRAFEPLVAAVDNDKLRSEAIDALGCLGDPRAEETLARFLEDDDLVSDAAQALASLDPPAYDRLYKALKHENWTVRLVAARVLARKHDPETLDTLIELYPWDDVQDQDSLSQQDQVRECILWTFVTSSTSEHVPFLVEAFKDGGTDNRQFIVWLGMVGDPRAVPALIEVLNDPSKGSVREAVEALGKISDARAVGPLVEVLARWDQQITYSARTVKRRRRTFWDHNAVEDALYKIGGPSVRPLLRELQGTRENARCGAIRVLGRLRDRRAVEPLLRALNDMDIEIRILAAASLAQIGDPRAVRPLLDMAAEELKDGQSSAADTALWALGLNAIDPLILALDDNDEKIRQHATQALREIGTRRAMDAVMPPPVMLP